MTKENKDASEGCLFLVTLILSISGICSIVEGRYYVALLYCAPLICSLLYGVYYWIAIVPKQKKWNAIRSMYNLPYILDKDDGEQWSKGFLQLINTELKNVSESEKKNDLQQCQHIVKKMIKDESFENFHRAFRFTGCHLIVTNNEGKPITKIV